MLQWAHYRENDYEVQRWKNDQGETREIARDSEDPFRWRLSMAKLEGANTFSPFPGYDRVLVILRGGPVNIFHETRNPKMLSPLTSHSFKGEWKTNSICESVAEDFNVFAKHGVARANVYPSHLSPKEELQFPLAGQEHFLFGVDGVVEIIDPNNSHKSELRPGETLRFSRTDDEEFLNLKARAQAPGATCLWVVVHVKR